MKSSTKNKSKDRQSEASYETNNPSSFKPDGSLTPSDNLVHLLSVLSMHKMELETMDAIPVEFDPELVITITGVIMKGDPGIVANTLYKVRPELLSYLTSYVEGIESINSKYYEITKCRYLIMEFLYEINFSDPNFYDPNQDYYVHFIQNPLSEPVLIRGSFLMLDPRAKQEMQEHILVRNQFLNNLLQFIDLKLTQLTNLSYKEQISHTVVETEEKEWVLLAIWVAMKESRFLSHLKDQELSKQRKLFFEVFNCVDKAYNRRHQELKRGKLRQSDLLKTFIKKIGVSK